jgi:hypothetical protein
LSKEADSIDFHEEMAVLGVHILLSLPNGMAVTAEIDQLYSKFKPRCSDSTIRVAGIKMAKRATMRKKCIAKAPINVDAPIELDLEDSDESSESKDNETPAHKKKGGRSLCNISMGNLTLPTFLMAFLVKAWRTGRLTIPSQKKTSLICG